MPEVSAEGLICELTQPQDSIRSAAATSVAATRCVFFTTRFLLPRRGGKQGRLVFDNDMPRIQKIDLASPEKIAAFIHILG
ncbi:MAG TPA: hypothetical protein DCZ97_11860 [Syntrophus sp. (in: bacteria)]|nr:hypothetical protein [Syntrophus sp. (in: bacteria)]